MAIDSDPLAIKLQHSKQELTAGIEQQLAAATAAGVLSMIPGVGSAIQSLLDGRARERVERRWVELFEDLRERIEAVRDRIPDPHYYGSEEFQTLLALAWEQLMTTHDHAKLHMLAAALANSGTAEFREDDKELLIRAMRDVAATDVHLLKQEKSRKGVSKFHPVFYPSDEMARLSRLAGLGLLHECHISGMDGGPEVGRDRIYFLSEFGERFLQFIHVKGHAA